VINGTTGESPTTSGDEKAELVRVVSAAVGKSKTIAGIGGNDTRSVIQTAIRAHDAGAGRFWPSRPTTTSRRRRACIDISAPSRKPRHSP
jgi:dihydrodipicolinate synthase/N-acetylneuraminate lyase